MAATSDDLRQLWTLKQPCPRLLKDAQTELARESLPVSACNRTMVAPFLRALTNCGLRPASSDLNLPLIRDHSCLALDSELNAPSWTR